MRRIADYFGYGGTMFSVSNILPIKINVLELGQVANQLLGTIIALLTIIYWIKKLNEKRKK